MARDFINKSMAIERERVEVLNNIDITTARKVRLMEESLPCRNLERINMLLRVNGQGSEDRWLGAPGQVQQLNEEVTKLEEPAVLQINPIFINSI